MVSDLQTMSQSCLVFCLKQCSQPQSQFRGSERGFNDKRPKAELLDLIRLFLHLQPNIIVPPTKIEE